jgi:hypothetical protein
MATEGLPWIRPWQTWQSLAIHSPVGDVAFAVTQEVGDFIAHAPEDLRLALAVVNAVRYDPKTETGHGHVHGIVNLCTCGAVSCAALAALDALEASL